MRFLFLVLAPAALLAQHGQIPVAPRNPAMKDPAAVAAGAKLYATSCAGCHGPDGTGGRGPNLIHKLESDPLKDDELFNIIRHGIPGADMPATSLSDDDTWRLAAFIRALTGPAIETDVPGDAAAGVVVDRRADRRRHVEQRDQRQERCPERGAPEAPQRRQVACG